MNRIAHLTSVHKRHDTRIFMKQCRSLAEAGHEVFLVVADGKGDETSEGVRIRDVGRSRGRIERMSQTTRRLLSRAIALDADIYHLHDPELLPIGVLLRRRGKRVLFDAHEDLPKQILSKPYLKPALRRPISYAAGFVESWACRRLTGVVCATPSIRRKFEAAGLSATEVNNYPLLGELEAHLAWEDKRPEVSYVGGMTEIRGFRELIAAMALTRSGARLNLAGEISGEHLKAVAERAPGWKQVNELGFLSRSEVREILGRSVAGVVTFLPAPNHIDAQPNKMFEYMSAGLPVIASDFPMWREVIEGNECGICVDPSQPQEIASAIDRLVTNPDIARRFGENGRRAVHERYNWDIEKQKLLSLYAKLLPVGIGR